MHHGFNHYWDIFYLTAFLVKEDGSLDLDSVPVPVDWTGTFDFVALVVGTRRSPASESEHDSRVIGLSPDF